MTTRSEPTSKRPLGERLRTSMQSRWGLPSRQMSAQERRATLDHLFPREHIGAYTTRFSTLLGLSALIAFCGLQANSTAVVIGAMLVAPLMEPILAMAGALVMNWRRRLVQSAALVAWGCLLTISIAAVLGLLIPDRLVVVPEVLSRTKPTLLDLGVALGAGTAGAYTLVRRVSVAAAGVAVAVALVPPLTVVGITLEEGRLALASGALLLFVTNFLAILLAATVVFLLAGFAPAAVRRRSGSWIATGISTTAIGLMLIAVPLSLYTSVMFRKEHIRDAVVDSVDEWRGFLAQDVVGIRLEEDGAIVLDILAETDPPAMKALANSIASRLGEDAQLQVRWVKIAADEIRGEYRGKTNAIRRYRPRSFEQLY